MGIETIVANKKAKELVELEEGTNILPTPPPPPPPPPPNPHTNNARGKKGGRRRPHKRTAVNVPPVQKLYNTCKEVFAFASPGLVPSSDKLEKLRLVLDKIKLGDVGLCPDTPYFLNNVAGGCPPIRYLHLYENDQFSMGIFCLPPFGVIPLHNHPGMTVFSKLLFGTMHIKSYDWVVNHPGNNSSVVSSPEEVKQAEGKPPEVQQAEGKLPEVQQAEVKQPEVQETQLRLAKVKVDSDFTAPCNSCILYPADGGNMHCFTARTACAVLDVLSPPYSDPDGRHCQYYYDFPYVNISVDGVSVPDEERDNYAWLQEREFPEDLAVVGGVYKGPRIVE